MPLKLLRRYGVGCVIDFDLFDPTGINLLPGAVHASGDTLISIDGASETPTINGFTSVGGGYRMAFDASEMTGQSMRINIVDQDPTKVWLDDFVIIETYGHANAMHQFIDTQTLIDGVTFEQMLEFLMAMANGNFEKGVPTAGDITFFKRDGTTPAFVINVNENDGTRTRLSP